MLYKLFIFLLFLSPLVFFHELGHFLFARLFGVRVEVFSIGFGKKLFSFTRGDTEYRFSLIPLGGFVKMFGDDPFKKDEISEEEKKFAFNHKSKWARFWIVFGGPLANFLLAFAIYFALISKGEVNRVFKVGSLKETSRLKELGFKTGDIVNKVNNQQIYGQEDFIFLEESNNTFEVRRGDETLEIQANIQGEDFLRDFYQNAESLTDPYFIDENGNKFFVYPKKELPETLISLQEIISLEPKEVYLFTADQKEITKKIDLSGKHLLEEIREQGYISISLLVKRVVPGAPAKKAEIQKNDIILGTKNKDFLTFLDLRQSVQESKGESIAFKVLRSGEVIEKEISPAKNKLGEQTFYSIGIESSIQIHQAPEVEIKGRGFIGSLTSAYKRTYAATYKTVEGFQRIFFSAGALGSIGGPVAIATVASESLSISLEHFLRLMAIISINLAIINLFPIPVLDGGHILFLALEGINRGPLTRKKMEIAQQFGLSLLFILLSIAIFNDVSRYVVPMLQ